MTVKEGSKINKTLSVFFMNIVMAGLISNNRRNYNNHNNCVIQIKDLSKQIILNKSLV